MTARRDLSGERPAHDLPRCVLCGAEFRWERCSACDGTGHAAPDADDHEEGEQGSVSAREFIAHLTGHVASRQMLPPCAVCRGAGGVWAHPVLPADMRGLP